MTRAYTWTLVPSERKELLSVTHLLEEKIPRQILCLSLHRELALQWPRTFHLNYRNEGEKCQVLKGKGTPNVTWGHYWCPAHLLNCQPIAHSCPKWTFPLMS